MVLRQPIVVGKDTNYAKFHGILKENSTIKKERGEKTYTLLKIES